jgi:hypothetical protein
MLYEMYFRDDEGTGTGYYERGGVVNMLSTTDLSSLHPDDDHPLVIPDILENSRPPFAFSQNGFESEDSEDDDDSFQQEDFGLTMRVTSETQKDENSYSWTLQESLSSGSPPATYPVAMNLDTEPTPIGGDGPKVIGRMSCLPKSLTTFCDDYISVLKSLQEPGSSYRQGSNIEETFAKARLPQVYYSSLKSNGHEKKERAFCSPSRHTSASPKGLASKKRSILAASIRIHPYQSEKWMHRYHDLLEYRKQNGHCNVPFDFKEKPFLSQWVKRQRHQYKCKFNGKHSHLTSERIGLLEMVGFIWDSHAAAWEENFEVLKEFKKKHNHSHVPIALNQLSTWVKRQRRQYKRFISKLPSTLTEDRISRLTVQGFVWNASAR